MSIVICYFFFFNDTATTEIYTLSLHDALPISGARDADARGDPAQRRARRARDRRLHVVGDRDHQPRRGPRDLGARPAHARRSEEHTSELQSRQYLVCRLLLEKKKTKTTSHS